MRKQEQFKLIAAAVALIVSYIPTFQWMVGRWSAKDTYYSHGFLVPFISAYLIWLKREKLKKLEISPVNVGWLLFTPGIFIHVISTLCGVSFSSGFSLLLVIPGLVLIMLGRDYFKELLFPIFFLIFMLPLPMVAIANISFRLKIFAAQISTFIVKAMGMPVMREGSTIRTAHSTLMVEDPCSGIRSLVALIALGALMAYFSNRSKMKKAALFLSSVPIAISANIFRIVSLIFASEIYGSEFATGKFHDAIGILVFVFAFLGLSMVDRLME